MDDSPSKAGGAPRRLSLAFALAVGAVVVLVLAGLSMVMVVGIAALVYLTVLSIDRMEAQRSDSAREAELARDRVRLIVDTAGQAFVSIDAEGRVIEWNPKAEAVFGWQRDEAMGCTLPERGLERFPATGEGEVVNRPVELSARHRDGHEFPVELTISPLRVGGEWTFNAFIQDITERRRAEERMAASEARFRALVDQSPGGTYEVNIEGMVTSANQRWREMAGLPDGDLEAVRYLDLVHPDDRGPMSKLWEASVESGEPFEMEYRLLRPDGGVAWVSGRATTVYDADGEPAGYFGAGLDITGRRLIEAELRLQGQITENMAEGVLLVRHSDDKIVSANRRFEEIYGYGPGELDEMDANRINARSGRDPLDVTAEIQSAVAEDGFWSGDLHNVKKNGTTFWCHVTVSVFEHPEHGLVSVAVHEDITAEREAQRAVHQAEERFRGAFELAPIGMAEVGLDGIFTRVNAAMGAIVGHPSEELEGRSFESITHPDDMDRDHDEIRAMLKGETRSREVEKRYLHANGHPVWVQLNATLVRDDDGDPLHFLIQVQDITARRSYERQLQHMADHDPLTGVLNRRSFERELKRHVAEIERYGAEGAALVLDLDNFKYYNDTLGHHVGDELIVRIARVLQQRLRETDVVARLGGDEFAVILPKEDVHGARIVADALLDCIRAEGRRADVGRGRAITASIGIAMFDDEERLTGEDVLVNADLAMYDAKEAGRDRIALYQTDDRAQGRMQGRIKWVDQIRTALDEDGFTLLAQPIAHLSGSPCDRYELLLRMNGPDGDLIPPGTFLYIAERLGWVNEIDRWVSGRAIRILSERPGIQLEVNLSGLSIGDDRLLHAVERDLRATGVDPSRLTFEITETAAVANIAKARAFAERLSELGCKFALDDFGAGFGSFYYLKHLPFDFLKIDGEFVKGCASSKTDRLLIEAVVGIARGMGKRTIAEFVNDDDTVRTLRRLGVDFGQGYHLGHPERLEALLGVAVAHQ